MKFLSALLGRITGAAGGIASAGLAPLMPWILGIVAALFLAGAATIAYQRLELRAARVELLAANLERDTAIAANKTLAETVGRLQSANRELAEGRRADQVAAAEAAAALENYRRQVAGELAAARSDRSRIYETDPSAAAWSRARVPDAIADRLRK